MGAMSSRVNRREFLGSGARSALGLGIPAASEGRPRAPRSRRSAPSAEGSTLRTPELVALHRAVRDTLASGRIGPAVFVRYLVEWPRRGRLTLDDVARLASEVAAWVARPVETVYALGALDGPLSVTLLFPGGQTALLGIHRTATATPSPDLMVLGSRGAIHHDRSSAGPWNFPAGGTDAAPPAAGLADALARSLRSARPERPGTGV
jgi:hypothetical protein